MAEHHGMQEAHAHAPAHGHGHDHAGGPDAPPHVGWKKYVLIGVILAAVTVLEVAAVESHIFPANVVIPALMVLTVAKFFLVVLYYMHLKMDHAIFGRVFWGPLFLAVLVVLGLFLLFHIVPTWGKFSN